MDPKMPRHEDTQGIPIVPDPDPKTSGVPHQPRQVFPQQSAYPIGSAAGYYPEESYYLEDEYPDDAFDSGSSSKRSTFTTMGILVLLIVASLALGWWVYTSFLSPAEKGMKAAPVPQTVTTTTVVIEAVPPTELETSSGTSNTSTSSSRQTVAPTNTKKPDSLNNSAAQAPQQAVQCAANRNWRIFSVNEYTSCGFAENTAIEMAELTDAGYPVEIQVISPATAGRYVVTCTPVGEGSFSCQGGDGAYVFLEARSIRDQ
ncbi:hypothetical protein [Corynebacterium caspium]|uniref:hypothetical protein n=1 Tax=Corynebacterium caspium TaxID=234828 RepID=UPI00036590F5|nr:hypothetical protein [Corynebacterium caspium]WKD59375.1 hypothetical protein CCASP_04915 [Corynebacterium caspium DSM 44850]